MKKIAVIGDPRGWSSQRLVEAVARRTGFALLVDMAEARLDLAKGTVFFRGHDLSKLDALIIKKIAPAYSPDILDRLEMLRFLYGRGLPVFSKPCSIIKLVDRLSCTVGLRLGDIPMPETTATESVAEAVAMVEIYGKAVFKPLFSTKARGMTVIEAGPSAWTEVEVFKARGNQVMYIQKFVNHAGRDLGVTFLGGEYVATYARQGSEDSWNTTTRSGGKYAACEPGPEIIELARRAQALFDLDFTCVDVVETPDGPKVYEVSAFGGFRGLLEANDIDAAGLFVEHVLRKLA